MFLKIFNKEKYIFITFNIGLNLRLMKSFPISYIFKIPKLLRSRKMYK